MRSYTTSELGRVDEAVADCNKAIALDPDDAFAFAHRGWLHMRMDAPEKALEDCNRCVAMRPRRTFGYRMRGSVFAESGAFDKALQDCEKVLALEPENPAGYTLRAGVYRRMGQYDKALADRSKVIAMRPEHFEGYISRAVLHFDMGQFERVLADAEKAIEIAPEAGFYAQVLRFEARARLGRDGTADLTAFRRTVDDDVLMLPMVRMLLGEITPQAYLAGETDTNVWADRTRRCRAHYHLAQFHLIHHDVASARDHLNKCLATGLKGAGYHLAARAELKRLRKPPQADE